MEDILSVIENVNPDAVYIEARKETFEQYGIVDGPIDMCVVYSYCIEHNIPVKMIDWWVLDKDSKQNTTTPKRDDNIFKNISDELQAEQNNKKILIVCGSGHLNSQANRFKKSGAVKKSIPNLKGYFVAKNPNFTYPKPASDIWEKRSYFYAYIFPDIVEKSAASESYKEQYRNSDHDKFYNNQIAYCDLFSSNGNEEK